MSSCSGPGGRREAFSRTSCANFVSRSCKESICLKRRRCLNTHCAGGSATGLSATGAYGSLPLIQRRYGPRRMVPKGTVNRAEQDRASGIDSSLPGPAPETYPGRQPPRLAAPARAPMRSGPFCAGTITRRSLSDRSLTPYPVIRARPRLGSHAHGRGCAYCLQFGKPK